MSSSLRFKSCLKESTFSMVLFTTHKFLGVSFNREGTIALAEPPAPTIVIFNPLVVIPFFLRSATNPGPSVESHAIVPSCFQRVLAVLVASELDFLIVVHTTRMTAHPDMRLDYCMNDPYYGLARKIGLLKNTHELDEDEVLTLEDNREIPKNYIDMGHIHHRTHAALAFYNSGFETAAAVIVDGAGSWCKFGAKEKEVEDYWETETIFDCAYPHKFDTRYKHLGSKFASPFNYYNNFCSRFWSGYGKDVDYESPQNENHEIIATHKPGIVKCYEAVTEYCGFPAIEAGKTMGLSPYGQECDYIPPLFNKCGILPVKLADSNVFTPMYPNGAIQNLWYEPEINEVTTNCDDVDSNDPNIPQPYEAQSRKNFAWRVQNDTQEQVLDLIRKAVKDTGNRNVVLSGGYGLNCVANYWYLDKLKDEGINLYVEPVSNDGGTALGAALLWHHYTN